ncbi:MAG: hypothetical protein LBS20_17800 [Prevotella sp.]|jgi:hypothetical protein|nr:hypothetical protein [Prevotella sp.]
MNINDSREILVKKIIECIPPHIKPVDYLMNELDISRVSVYRRLKCILPFTYDEIAALSVKLGLSLDNIIYNTDNRKAIFSFQQYNKMDSQYYFSEVLKKFSQNLKEQNKANRRQAIVSINNLWLIYVFGYDHLLRFYYGQWLHQNSLESYKLDFSEIQLSPEIVYMSHKIQKQVQNLAHTLFIIDKKLFFNTINNIQYYYRRNFFGKDELLHLADELKIILDYTAAHVLKGKNVMEQTRLFYLSLVNLYSNSILVNCDGNLESFFYGYLLYPFKITNIHFCLQHKEWLESLKKNSVLMTASNEALQIDFFKKQQEYLERLINNNDLVK